MINAAHEEGAVANFLVWENEQARDAWDNCCYYEKARAALGPMMTEEEWEISVFDAYPHTIP